MQSFASFAGDVRAIASAVAELDSVAQNLAVRPLSEWPFYKLLRDKLLPQVASDPYVVAAVVGGTNVGKSAIFNTLAGTAISGVSPFAAKTRHVVALLPRGFRERHELEQVFPQFRIEAWRTPDDPLRECDEHVLFWRESDALPGNLVLCDTPDIDSVVRTNWERAACLRRAADVLIAVLTGEKYHDHAVRDFFREAAREGKAVAVVFNRVDLQHDEPFCRGWLEQFLEATGVQPVGVYLAPFDRAAANDARLSLRRRDWLPRPILSKSPHDAASTDLHVSSAPTQDESPDGAKSPPLTPAETTLADNDTTADDTVPDGTGSGNSRTDSNELRRDLCDLRFDAIKLLSLRGALQRLCDPDEGIPAYERALSSACEGCIDALEKIVHAVEGERTDWPIPDWTATVWPRIREELFARGEGWEAYVHRVYDGLAEWTVNKPLRWLRSLSNRSSARQIDGLPRYREEEWRAITALVERLFERLSAVRRDHRLKSMRVEAALNRACSGTRREDVLKRLQQRHQAVDDTDLD
ncbi:MAG: hypothetical protein D6725_17770, partial [Planctomycetota bacterium]